MALTFSSLGGSTTGFAIDTGDGTKTDVTLAKEYPAGGYQISSANGNQGLYIFFGASDGSPAGGTSSKSIVATKAFNKITIVGVTANDLITFTYKETATLNAVGTSSSYSGAVVTSFTPNQVSSINDTVVLSGAAFGNSVTVKFTGANGTSLNAKSITRVSDTQLIVTRPDTMPGDQDPYKITVQNPGIEPAVSTNVSMKPLYAGLAPVWSTAATLPAFSKNISYTQQLTASDPDGTAITYSFVNGSLPAGLTYAANSSTISGTPTGSTSASFTIRATEASGRYTDRTFTLPDAYPVFTTAATLTPYTKNVSYSATIVATDDSGVAPSLSVVGTMPSGFSFNALTGSVSGTPTTSTTQNFTIRATDANGSTTDQTFIIPNTGPTWVTASGNLSSYTKGVSYSTTLSANDDGTLTYSIISGTVPAGLTLSSSGIISGIATDITNNTFTVRVTDDAGNYADRSFTINNIGPAAPVWSTTAGSLANGTQNSSYSVQLSATDDSGAAPTYSIASGTLPAGLTLSSSGLISGTPTAGNGAASFTVRATDTNGTYTDRSFNIGVLITQSLTSSGTWTSPSGVTSVPELLLVGGGGGGGATAGYASGTGGGGGGGGGVKLKTNLTVTPNTAYSYTVGSGGSASASSTGGQPGGNTTIFGITAYGGNGGSNSGWDSGVSQSPAGSGGGGSNYISGQSSGPAINGGVTTADGQYANNGASAGSTGGGGGGGAGSAGGGQNGGSGYTYSFNSTVYGSGGGGGNSGSGGSGAGNGSSYNGGNPGSGTSNRGGGGGGASSNSQVAGAPGGSGIIILRYLG